MSVDARAAVEIVRLRGAGLDARVAEPDDPQELDRATQAELDRQIAAMEADVATGAQTFRGTATTQSWVTLLMKALALHPVCAAATLKTLGEGVADDAFDLPLELCGGRRLSAREAVALLKGPAAAEHTVERYRSFVDTPVDDWARLLFRGMADGRGVRNRAAVATDLVLDHLGAGHHRAGAGSADRPLVSASLACGAAGPVYQLVEQVEARLGLEVGEILLLDIDAMALACAGSLAGGTAVADRGHPAAARPAPLTAGRDGVRASSVDVADALGLVEYLPDAAATALLTRVRTELLAPGGIVVFGNMLDHRPQGTFLEQVVRWPRLLRRSVTDMLAILRAAGYDVRRLRVRVTSDGVYAVYAVGR